MLVATILTLADVPPGEIAGKPETPHGDHHEHQDRPLGRRVQVGEEKARPGDEDEPESPNDVHDRCIVHHDTDHPCDQHEDGDNQGRSAEQVGHILDLALDQVEAHRIGIPLASRGGQRPQQSEDELQHEEHQEEDDDEHG